MKPEFTPIAMKCNQEQFDAIRPKLEKIEGVRISYIDNFLDRAYLVNNFGGEILKVTNLSGITKGTNSRTVYEEWNEQIFLEACGYVELKKELPMYFVIQQCEHPLWKKYIDWLNSTYKLDLRGDINYAFYGYEGSHSHSGINYHLHLSCFKNNPTVLTLEEWDSIVNGSVAEQVSNNSFATWNDFNKDLGVSLCHNAEPLKFKRGDKIIAKWAHDKDIDVAVFREYVGEGEFYFDWFRRYPSLGEIEEMDVVFAERLTSVNYEFGWRLATHEEVVMYFNDYVAEQVIDYDKLKVGSVVKLRDSEVDYDINTKEPATIFAVIDKFFYEGSETHERAFVFIQNDKMDFCTEMMLQMRNEILEVISY